ncbi:MAG TPA: hypothetical protein VIM65_12220 [Cyclobacteriaceae bacterium]
MKQRHLILLLSVILISWTTPIIELEKRKILGDKVEILIPKEFEVMSEDMMNLKYPSNRRPTLVYTDKTGGINIAFNHTASKATQQQIDAYKDNFVSTFKNLYPSAEWIGTGTKEINGRKVGYMELLTPAVDTKIYNLMFFTDLDGRLLLGTFNCVDKKQSDWTEPAKQIMNSLTIK